MRNPVNGFAYATALAVVAAALAIAVRPTSGQTPDASGYRIPRTADAKPDLNGIWEALNTANWDLQEHAAGQGPVIALGASFSVPAGVGVVDGGEILSLIHI